MPLLLCYLLVAAGLSGLRRAGAVRENRDVVQLLRGLAGQSAGTARGLLRTPWKSLPALINVVSGLLKDAPVAFSVSQ